MTLYQERKASESDPFSASYILIQSAQAEWMAFHTEKCRLLPCMPTSATLDSDVENLLFNAVKFSHRNSQFEVSLHQQDDTNVIKIKDSGLGMNEQQKVMLFEKENYLRRSGTDGESSSGLGIVKKIICQHGGEIRVESKEAAGTTFYLELPKK